MEKLIICSWKCGNASNEDYVSLNCSEKCVFLYHIPCWNLFLMAQGSMEESQILLSSCTKMNCSGFFFKILWFNKFGEQVKATGSKKKMKSFLINKKKNSSKTKESQESDANTFQHVADIIEANEIKVVPYIIESQDRSHEFHENTSFVLTEIDFGKLYELDKDSDQPYYDNDCFGNDFATMSNFGSIGEERKLKQTKYHEELLEKEDIFEEKDVFEELLGNTNIDYYDSTCLNQQSKFLNMIKKNSIIEENTEDSQEEFSNGFTFCLEVVNTSSPSLTYCPNMEMDNNFENDEDNEKHVKMDTQSFLYLPGAPGSWMLEEVQDCIELVGIEEVESEVETDKDKESGCKNCKDEMDVIETFCPFTKTIWKLASHYTVSQIEAAVREVMIEVDHSNTTIPHFQHLVLEKLELASEAVYISDDDEEVDECLICTELLELDLLWLEPCQHVFHLDCINEWLEKDQSCPKCRASVNKVE